MYSTVTETQRDVLVVSLTLTAVHCREDPTEPLTGSGCHNYKAAKLAVNLVKCSLMLTFLYMCESW